MNKAIHPFSIGHDSSDELNNLSVQTHCGPLSVRYLQEIESTLRQAVSCHSRTLVVRVDLRFPANAKSSDSGAISRFVSSLRAKIDADLKAKARDGKRIHPCKLRYVWVREQDRAPLHHYHVLLMLNADTYNCLGSYRAESGNLAYRIRTAWASAVGVEDVGGSVHFPDNAIYRIDSGRADYSESLGAVIYRASYMAKLSTKQYGDHVRHFGCSQG